MASSFTDRLEEGFRGMRKLHPILVMVIPSLMSVVAMIRNGFKKKAKSKKMS
jgi:hypothetical protein